MARRFEGGKLAIASHNPGKVREIQALLNPFEAEVISAGELGLPEPEETGDTFTANAELKARAAAMGANLPALADDSGIVVNGLNGQPGIYSARWGGPAKDFNHAMGRVWTELEAIEDKSAHFTSALALCWPDGHSEIFEGYIHGTIVWPQRGDKGFGYDPIFQPNGHNQTFGELENNVKYSISHRFQAFEKLVEACFKA
ncbi:MAG: RdgB/HAM1 family non-canonical purine NTP pyrophosphatase [Rhodospirillales bacterium]|jgi:XTP/dITP diphosphohydrolase